MPVSSWKRQVTVKVVVGGLVSTVEFNNRRLDVELSSYCNDDTESRKSCFDDLVIEGEKYFKEGMRSILKTDIDAIKKSVGMTIIDSSPIEDVYDEE